MPKYLAGAVMLLLCSALSFAQILEPTHTQRQEKAVTQQIKKAVNKQMAQEAIKQHQERHCYYCKIKLPRRAIPTCTVLPCTNKDVPKNLTHNMPIQTATIQPVFRIAALKK